MHTGRLQMLLLVFPLLAANACATGTTPNDLLLAANGSGGAGGNGNSGNGGSGASTTDGSGGAAGNLGGVDASSGNPRPDAAATADASSEVAPRDGGGSDAAANHDGAPTVDASPMADAAPTPDTGSVDDAGPTDDTGSDPAHVAECAMKLCVDPIFDCILQGCGDAVCENLLCIVH